MGEISPEGKGKGDIIVPDLFLENDADHPCHFVESDRPGGIRLISVDVVMKEDPDSLRDLPVRT